MRWCIHLSSDAQTNEQDRKQRNINGFKPSTMNRNRNGLVRPWSVRQLKMDFNENFMINCKQVRYSIFHIRICTPTNTLWFSKLAHTTMLLLTYSIFYTYEAAWAMGKEENWFTCIQMYGKINWHDKEENEEEDEEKILNIEK